MKPKSFINGLFGKKSAPPVFQAHVLRDSANNNANTSPLRNSARRYSDRGEASTSRPFPQQPEVREQAAPVQAPAPALTPRKASVKDLTPSEILEKLIQISTQANFCAELQKTDNPKEFLLEGLKLHFNAYKEFKEDEPQNFLKKMLLQIHPDKVLGENKKIATLATTKINALREIING